MTLQLDDLIFFSRIIMDVLATDKRKKAIETFVRQGRTASVNLSALKKKEASEIIGKVLGDGDTPSSPSVSDGRVAGERIK